MRKSSSHKGQAISYVLFFISAFFLSAAIILPQTVFAEITKCSDLGNNWKSGQCSEVMGCGSAKNCLCNTPVDMLGELCCTDNTTGVDHCYKSSGEEDFSGSEASNPADATYVSPDIAGAAAEEKKEPVFFTPNFTIPGSKFIAGQAVEVDGSTLGDWITAAYVFFVGAAGILAVVMMMYGGIKYTVSFGNPSKLQDARDTITSAMIGLVLVLGSYLILNFINPGLTSLKAPNLPVIHGSLFFWDNGSYFCEDQNQAEFSPVDPAKTTCGGLGVRPDGKNCYYRNGCDTAKGQMCIVNTDDLTAKCGSARDFCTKAADCKFADEQLQLAMVLDYGCSIPNSHSDKECIFDAIMECGSKWDQIACSETGGKDRTPCWTDGGPAIQHGIFKCTDTRGIYRSNAICCADVRNDVNCRTVCNNDEIAAPNCKLQNTVGGTYDLRQPDGGSDSCTDAQISAGMKCCVELKLKSASQGGESVPFTP
jgi:hypothetical protein